MFGFQLLAVFTATFCDMPLWMEATHLGALLLVTLSMILLLTPATYHRIKMPETEEEWFITFGSRFIVYSLLPLGAALVLDIFVLIEVAAKRLWLSATAAGVVARSAWRCGSSFRGPTIGAGEGTSEPRWRRNRLPVGSG